MTISELSASNNSLRCFSHLVSMCSHIDNTEHSVQVIVTEKRLADLRGMGPRQRAEKIIENCAHPMYRETLHKYLRSSESGHLPHNLDSCFTLHRNIQQYGLCCLKADNRITQNSEYLIKFEFCIHAANSEQKSALLFEHFNQGFFSLFFFNAYFTSKKSPQFYPIQCYMNDSYK